MEVKSRTNRTKASFALLIFVLVISLAFIASGQRFAFGGSATPTFSSSLHGVDYTWGPLGIQCCSPPPDQSFPIIKSLGFNLIRVPLSWNTLEQNPSAYIGYLDQIATEADSMGLYVVYDAHSAGGSNSEPGLFYPSSLKSQYTTESAFFTAWWNQKVKFNGQPGWTAVWNDFWLPVISAVDSHSSTLGYELENEPFVFQASESNLHQFNQFVASNIRTISAKYIIYMASGEGLNTAYDEVAAPAGINGLVLDAHCYISQASCSNVPAKLANLYSFHENTGIIVWIGEWAVMDGCCITEAQSETIVQEYVNLFDKYNFADSYWTWGCLSTMRDNQLLLPSSCTPFWLDSQLSQAEGGSGSTSSTTTTQSSSTTTTQSSSTTSTSSTSLTSTMSSSISTDSTTSSSSSLSSSLSSSTTSTLAGLKLDGSAKAASSSTNGLSISLSTTQSPDVLVVYAVSGNTHATMSISDGAGLDWIIRKSFVDSSFATMYEFYAVANSPMSLDTITVIQSKSDSLNIIGFGISGANTTAPFGVSTPAIASGDSTKPSVSLSVQESNDLVVGMLSTSGDPAISDGTGFSNIETSASFPSGDAEYAIASSTQTNVYATLSTTKYWMIMGDAIQPQNSSASLKSAYYFQDTLLALAFAFFGVFGLLFGMRGFRENLPSFSLKGYDRNR